MQILDSTIKTYNPYQNYHNSNFKYPNFMGNINPNTDKYLQNLDFLLKIFKNKYFDFFESKNTKQFVKNISLTKPYNKAFLEKLSEIGRLQSSTKIIDVNTEDKILEKLVAQDESVIFIMNHSNQKEDPQMLAAFYTLLSEAYKKNGKEKFPTPKIILNQDILRAMNSTKRKALENIGAVGIDANITERNMLTNAKILLPIIKDFINNKCNIFIFPEGKLAINKNLDYQDKFQIGTANLINKILNYKKRVTVVPIGFAYGGKKQKNLNSINIGTPIIIKQKENITTTTKGDIDKNRHSILYPFFKKHQGIIDIPITQDGKPVNSVEIAEYLKTIICENLETNSNLAKEKLKNTVNNLEHKIFKI